MLQEVGERHLMTALKRFLRKQRTDLPIYDPGTGTWTYAGGFAGEAGEGTQVAQLDDERVLITGGHGASAYGYGTPQPPYQTFRGSIDAFVMSRRPV